MYIQANVTLQEGDTVVAANEAVQALLTAFGADPATDTVSVSISASSTPPPPEPVQPIAPAQ